MRIYLEDYESRLFEGRTKQESDYQHKLGRRLLAFALTEAFGLQMTDTDLESCLSFTSAGKPCLMGHPDIHFNISHTSGLVICSVGDYPVGIDVEMIRSFPRAVLRKLTDRERAYIQSAKESDEAFMRVWTMKEACIKMTGEGLVSFERTECIPGQSLPGIQYRQFIWQGRYVVTAVETL